MAEKVTPLAAGREQQEPWHWSDEVDEAAACLKAIEEVLRTMGDRGKLEPDPYGVARLLGLVRWRLGNLKEGEAFIPE